jgi:hypothetical protein
MAKLDIQKWNWKNHKYEPYRVNPKWHIVLWTEDFDERINCTSCGEELYFGESYTSKELHTKIGLGYPVCGNCYALENDRKVESEQ